MSIIIEGIGIEKIYHTGGVANTVLKQVSLQIERGEFIAIMGRSGAGKSTLLYQLSLLDHPTSGEVILDGVHTADFTSSDRTRFRLENLGYVFQDYAIVPELTAIENVMTPLLMQGLSFNAAKKKSGDALRMIEMGDRLDYLPSQLSGGQQQRVSIARSIVHEPKILFADEPTANLDSEIARSILSVFRRLNENGQTIVMVTHEQEYGELADRIITLNDGRIVSYR